MATVIDIRQQPRLPLIRQLDICADGIRHRLLRSVITLAVVVLAVAFLMNVLTENAIAQSLKRGVFGLSAQLRLYNRYKSFYQGPIDSKAFSDRLLEAGAEDWAAPVLQNWLILDGESLTKLRSDVQTA